MPASENHDQERSSLLVVLACLWPSVIRHNDPRARVAVLYIETPYGQISFAILRRDLSIFTRASIEIVSGGDPRASWDGSGKAEHSRRLQLAAGDLARPPIGWRYCWSDTTTGQHRCGLAATGSDAAEIVDDLRARQQRLGRTPDAAVCPHHPCRTTPPR